MSHALSHLCVPRVPYRLAGRLSLVLILGGSQVALLRPCTFRRARALAVSCHRWSMHWTCFVRLHMQRSCGLHPQSNTVRWSVSMNYCFDDPDCNTELFGSPITLRSCVMCFALVDPFAP